MPFIRHKRLTAFVLSLAVLFYAIPRLPMQWEWTLPSWFALTWLTFALLVVAANWRSALGVDQEEAEQMERIERLKRWQRESLLYGRKDRYPRKERQTMHR